MAVPWVGIAGAVSAVLLVVLIVLIVTRHRRELAEATGGEASGGPRSGEKASWLVGQSGDHRGRTYRIERAPQVIGRDATCFIQVPEERASRRHCEVKARNGRLLVEDLKSANGTFVNGAPVRRARLKPGDELRICDSTFVFAVTAPNALQPSVTPRSLPKMAARETVAAEGAGVSLMVQAALKQTEGDIPAAARILGVPPSMVEAVIQVTGIDVPVSSVSADADTKTG